MSELRIRERTNRVRHARGGRHVGKPGAEDFSRTFTALGSLAYEGSQVSANVVDLATGRILVSIDDRIVLPTASIGKVLLLIEVSARLTSRDFTGYGILDKTPRDSVGDSGIWQHLQAPALPVGDLATLVGATSDNLATNLLLRQVGLDAVRARTESLGLARTALLDVVRDKRGPDDAPQLSVGSTSELSWLLGALARGRVGRDDLSRAYDLFPPLAERSGAPAATLSGGERQMLVIGRALMARPTVLLLDEPSLGLAPRVVTQIFGLLRGLVTDEGLTILLVEQNARSALAVADRGVVLNLGRVVADDDAATLAADEQLRHAYLGF